MFANSSMDVKIDKLGDHIDAGLTEIGELGGAMALSTSDLGDASVVRSPNMSPARRIG